MSRDTWWGKTLRFIGILLIDAVEARKEPGTLIRLEGEDVPAFMSIKIFQHQLGGPDMLAAAKLKDVYPQRIVLWGVQQSGLVPDLTWNFPCTLRLDPNATFPGMRSRSLNKRRIPKNVPDCNPVGRVPERVLRFHANT